jgi:polyhydroxyalkanoate synthase
VSPWPGYHSFGKGNPVAPKAPAADASESPPGLNGQEFARNMLSVGMKSQQLLTDFAARMGKREGPIDPLNISGAMMALAKAMGEDRDAVIAAQTQWWNDVMTLWESTARRMLGGDAAAVVEPAPGDRRFKAEAWRENEVFDFIKQSYLLTANAMQEMVGKLHGLDEKERGRIAFYTRQFADAFAPTNFPLTNPDVLKATLASNGDNLVKGLDNLLADIERGHGELSIRQSADGFTIGENIATTPGKVVFRNRIMELLQYSPTTDEVHERPLLIFPPWINKFYIIDLRPENSFVRWLVGQGYTVFLVSWVNPDAKLAQAGFEEYMRDGIFAALEGV